VHRLEADYFQDEQIDRALDEVGGFTQGRLLSVTDNSIRRSNVGSKSVPAKMSQRALKHHYRLSITDRNRQEPGCADGYQKDTIRLLFLGGMPHGVHHFADGVADVLGRFQIHVVAAVDNDLFATG
jgi:hypothetical protein